MTGASADGVVVGTAIVNQVATNLTADGKATADTVQAVVTLVRDATGEATHLSQWAGLGKKSPLVAGSFALFWSALDIPDPEGSLLLRLGTYLIAWSAGFVSIFSPQGIGVFELVVAWMMKGALPLASLAALVAGFRVLTLVGDVIAYGIGRIHVASGPKDGPAAH